MKFLFIMLALGALLAGCGKQQEKAKTEASSQFQAAVAKAKLQEKADNLAKASAPPPPSVGNNTGPKKP